MFGAVVWFALGGLIGLGLLDAVLSTRAPRDTITPPPEPSERIVVTIRR